MAASFRILVLTIRVLIEIYALEIVEVQVVDVGVSVVYHVAAFVSGLLHRGQEIGNLMRSRTFSLNTSLPRSALLVIQKITKPTTVRTELPSRREQLISVGQEIAEGVRALWLWPLSHRGNLLGPLVSKRHRVLNCCVTLCHGEAVVPLS
mgnify:CR=1 FL=1